MEIVGVAGNVKYLGPTVDTDPAYYMPFSQTYSPQMFLAVRSSGDAGGLTGALRRGIQSIDPGVTLAQIETMERVIENKLWRSRVSAFLLTIFAGIALVLTAVGIYGVIAYAVGRRTQEIGIRMALGATRAGVLKMVLSESMQPVATGILLGVLLAIGTTRFLTSLLYGVSATDLTAFISIVVCIAMTSLLAMTVPVLRALRADPVSALRHD